MKTTMLAAAFLVALNACTANTNTDEPTNGGSEAVTMRPPGPLAEHDLPEESCPNPILSDGDYVLECAGADNVEAVKSAKVGDKITSLDDVGVSPDWYGAVELNILPDADTSMLYSYTRKLLDKSTGELVGVISREAYGNSEMGVRYKLVTRYNLDGAIVSIRAANWY